MTNQEAFEAARAGDWIAESFLRSGDVFTITGKSTGYSSFADCLTDGQSIFYAAFDEDDNREAGLAVWDASAKTLTPVEIHATLIGGAFIKGDPAPAAFANGGTITGTFNATAFNAMWSHVWEKGNPHETEAKDIPQDNTNLLGDTVQDALDTIWNVVLTGDTEEIEIGIDNIDPETLKSFVMQDRAEDQQVISKFTFAVAGQAPLTVENTGIWNDANYVRYDTVDATWKVAPGLVVDGDFTVNGETSLNGNLAVDGTIDATGNISTDANLNVGGDLSVVGDGSFSGSLEVDGNLTLTGGIIDPDGNSLEFPVTSVNTQTGDVLLTAADVGALPDTYSAPVDSVNGKTGVVVLTAADVGASTYDGSDAVKLTGNQTVGGIKTFSSDIRCKANVYAYYGSDERLKDDITPMPVGLIDAIDASTWKWKEDGRASGGVIAQQLQEIGLDDWVRESPDGDLGVDYNALIGMLIAEVQDLKRRLADG